jgi:surfeit locus 1 family protein
MDLFKALYSRRWWWVSLLVVALMVVLARLGVWQLDRLQERRASNAAQMAALAAAPIDLNHDELPQEIEPLRDRQVEAMGTFDLDEQIVLLVQNWQGRSGVHLVAPLVLPGDETAVLVDRGWIPDAEANPEAIARYDQPDSTTVSGVVALSQIISRATGTAPGAPQSEWYRVDIDALQPQMPYDLLPFYIIQAPDGGEDLPYRSVPEVDLSEGSHLSYAVQWFIFSIGLGIGYLALVNKSLQQPEDV